MTLVAVTLAAVRLVGALVFIDFAFGRETRRRYPVLAAGWLLYAVSPLLRIPSAAPDDLLGLLYGLTATLGILVVTFGALSYLRPYPLPLVSAAAAGIAAAAFLLWLSPWSGRLPVFFASAQFLVLIGVFSRVVFDFRSFYAVGGRSYYWAAAILILGGLHALAYLTVYPTYPEQPLPYAVTMILSVMLIVFYIHLEHTISLRERETLLAEVHHRVRNNLQLIESLLSLERAYRSPEEYEELVGDVYRKIHSLSLIHELVYEEGTYSCFDIAAYARRLGEEVTGTERRGRSVQCRVEADSLFLSMERVIPLSMVLQEALENAALHAGEAPGPVEIRVEVGKSEGNRGLIRVADNGPGFPPGFDPAHGGRLGFTLINQLVRQIGGNLVIERCGGGCLRVEFPL
jgi:two-component sensor histidine kinase